MQLISLIALLPALALAIPADLAPRQAQSSVSTITKTVTATKTATTTKTVSVCPSSSSSSSVAKSSATSSSASKPASSSSSSKSAVSSSSSTSKPASSSSSSTSKSTSAPAATSSSASGVSAADQAQYLKLHNDFRAQYSANAVTWNDTLASYALKTAQTCKYGHTGGPYGENIAAGVGGGYNINSAFTAWGPNEASKYDYNNPGWTPAAGHFTQIVWKSTNQIGCASALCADGTIFTGYGQPSLYVVCEYAPPGNIIGNNNQYFKDNVAPKKA